MRVVPVWRGGCTRNAESVEVRSHSGFRQGEYPKSIFVDGAWRPVEAVLERWVEEDRGTGECRRCFVVRLCRREGTLCLFQSNEDAWFLDRSAGGAARPTDRDAAGRAPGDDAGPAGRSSREREGATREEEPK